MLFIVHHADITTYRCHKTFEVIKMPTSNVKFICFQFTSMDHGSFTLTLRKTPRKIMHYTDIVIEIT